MTKMMEEETSPDIEDSVNPNRWLLNQNPAYDRLLNADIQLQLGEEYVTGKVRRPSENMTITHI